MGDSLSREWNDETRTGQYTGTRIGRCTVLNYLGKDAKKSGPWYRAKCDCGIIFRIHKESIARNRGRQECDNCWQKKRPIPAGCVKVGKRKYAPTAGVKPVLKRVLKLSKKQRDDFVMIMRGRAVTRANVLEAYEFVKGKGLSDEDRTMFSTSTYTSTDSVVRDEVRTILFQSRKP